MNARTLEQMAIGALWMTGFLFLCGLIAFAVFAVFAGVGSHAEKYNRSFDAACVSRGGVPTQLSRDRICTAPGVMK